MAALRSVDVSTLAHYCRTGQLSLAGAIEGCVICVFVEQGDVFSGEGEHNRAVKTTAKLNGESSLFLLHALNCCCIADLAHVVRSPRITNQTLQCLYEWMVKENCPTSLFDAVALAIQESHVQVDVQLEQRFAGHALSLIFTSYDDGDHEEADEL